MKKKKEKEKVDKVYYIMHHIMHDVIILIIKNLKLLLDNCELI